MINTVTYTGQDSTSNHQQSHLSKLIRQQLVTWLEAVAVGVRVLVGRGFVGKGQGCGDVGGLDLRVRGCKLVGVATQG